MVKQKGQCLTWVLVGPQQSVWVYAHETVFNSMQIYSCSCKTFIGVIIVSMMYSRVLIL